MEQGEPISRAAGANGKAPAGRAFLELQQELFATMRERVDGIRADLDPRPLHDFRVALRKSRVLQRLFSDLIEGTDFAELDSEMRWVHRMTAPTRDLDVLLAELRASVLDPVSDMPDMPELPEMAPQDPDPLARLIDGVRARRQQEWAKLDAMLASPRFEQWLGHTSELFDSQASAAAERLATTGPPLLSWVSDQIRRAHRRLVKHGRKIDDASPDARLHAVRIDAKRLRYLLELFRGLYPKTTTSRVLRKLNRLQDNLGRFNDACVQRETLRRLAHELDRCDPDTLLAIGRLVERAETRRRSERQRFEHRFERFDAAPTRRRFRKLVKKERREQERPPRDRGRRLWILRHAKSSGSDASLADHDSDHDRPLATRGERAARLVGNELARRGASPDLVLGSTALRVQQTLEGVRQALPEPLPVTLETSLYLAPADAWLERLRGLHDETEVLIVGHNPGLEELVRLLAPNGEALALARLSDGLKTATLVEVELELGEWSEVRAGVGRLLSTTRPPDLASKRQRHDDEREAQSGERTADGRAR